MFGPADYPRGEGAVERVEALVARAISRGLSLVAREVGRLRVTSNLDQTQFATSLLAVEHDPYRAGFGQ